MAVQYEERAAMDVDGLVTDTARGLVNAFVLTSKSATNLNDGEAF